MGQQLGSNTSCTNAKTCVKLYDAHNIDGLSWPETAQGQFARQFLFPLVKEGTRAFIENVDTKMVALAVGDVVLPVTINDAQYENSYVCSPYGHYVSCALEAIEQVKNPVIAKSVRCLVNGLGKVLRKGQVNKAVIVNNWLFSTNLYPELSKETVQAIRDFLCHHFPDHSVIFLSIHNYTDSTFFQSLKTSGFKLIASREVCFLNPKREGIFTSRIFKSDFKLLRECGYEVISEEEISSDQAERLESLYRAIYLDRHSLQNPIWTKHFFKRALENKGLKFKALRKEGKIDAIAGYYCVDETMVSPLLGYDITLTDAKLYRLICTALTHEARHQNKLFHLSSGATFFKKIRRAEAAMEYNAIYVDHLSLARKFPWMVLKLISNSIGVAFMRYFNRMNAN